MRKMGYWIKWDKHWWYYNWKFGF